MAYPPPYQPARPKSGTNPLVWVLVAIGAFCCVAVIGFGAMTFTTMKQVGNMMPCMFTASAAQKSLLEYEKEKGKFPPADKWQSEIAPYYEKHRDDNSKEMKDAPMGMDKWANTADITKPLACNTEGMETFLVYNPDVAGKKASDFENPDETVMLYEDTAKALNAAAPYKERPLKESPRMMGQPRGWYVLHVSGDLEMTSKTKGRRVKVDIESGR